MNIERTVPLCAALLAFALGGCGGSDDTFGVSNVSPVGSIGGRVIDAATRQAVPGAKVQVIAGGSVYPEAPVASDDSGRFAIQQVPAGNLIVRIEPPAGYAPVEINTALGNAAGEFPLGNATRSFGPLGLVPLNTDQNPFTVRLVNGDGSPAASVDAQLRADLAWVDFDSTTGLPRGNIVVAAKSSSAGVASFTGIPDFGKLAGLVGVNGITDTVRLSVPPFDANGDGVYDSIGKEVSLSVNALSGSVPTVVLGPAGTPTLQVLATTIAALDGQKGNRAINGTAGPLFIVFNWPIVKDRSAAVVHDEFGAAIKAPTIQVDGNTMTLTFDALAAGAEYNLSVHAVGDAEGRMVSADFGAPFFTPAATGKAVTVSLAPDVVPDWVRVVFSEPVGSGNAGANLNGVLFFDFDIDDSGTIGDAAGELGGSSSPYSLQTLETDPPGPAGLSGLSSRWRFRVPLGPGGTPLPAATTVQFNFSSSSTAVTRGNGDLAQNLAGALP